MTRRYLRTSVRSVLDVVAIVVIVATIASIETMPSHLPALLAGAALAIAYLWRRSTVISRRADRA